MVTMDDVTVNLVTLLASLVSSLTKITSLMCIKNMTKMEFKFTLTISILNSVYYNLRLSTIKKIFSASKHSNWTNT